jgi:hypothetical protein
MATKWEKLRAKVKATDKEVLKKAIMVDGHTIYKPEKFLDAGLDKDVVKAFTKVHESGSHPKEQISTDAGPVNALEGVYGLDVLEFIASVFDVSSWKMGRGSRVGHLVEQLLEKWA